MGRLPLTFALRGWLVPDTIHIVIGCTENRGIPHHGELLPPPAVSVAVVGDRSSVSEERDVTSVVISIRYFWRGQTWNC